MVSRLGEASLRPIGGSGRAGSPSNPSAGSGPISTCRPSPGPAAPSRHAPGLGRQPGAQPARARRSAPGPSRLSCQPPSRERTAGRGADPANASARPRCCQPSRLTATGPGGPRGRAGRPASSPRRAGRAPRPADRPRPASTTRSSRRGAARFAGRPDAYRSDHPAAEATQRVALGLRGGERVAAVDGHGLVLRLVCPRIIARRPREAIRSTRLTLSGCWRRGHGRRRRDGLAGSTGAGHRAGTDRVPADLLQRASVDRRPVLRRRRPGVGVHRDHPARHRGGGDHLLPQGHRADHLALVPLADRQVRGTTTTPGWAGW